MPQRWMVKGLLPWMWVGVLGCSGPVGEEATTAPGAETSTLPPEGSGTVPGEGTPPTPEPSDGPGTPPPPTPPEGTPTATPAPTFAALYPSYPSVTFSPTRVGSQSAFIQTITNVSQDARQLTALSIGGEDASSFGVDDSALGPAGLLLAPGETLDVLLIFSPEAIGELSGALYIDSDDPVAARVTVPLSGTATGTDLDGDGYAAEVEDCDDRDPDVHPGAEDVCDGVDNDCDGTTDTGAADSDGDGAADCVDVCPEDPEDDTDLDTACGDVDNCPDLSNPSQADNDGDGVGNACDVETCDGVDNNGNGVTDEGFPDADNDTLIDCVDPCPQDVYNDDDDDGACGDVDNCAGLANPSQSDVDEDGIGDVCDVETCDGLDDDGDGETDEGFDEDGVGGGDCVDNDKDGYSEDGSVGGKADCDDGSALVAPGKADAPVDGVDTDCDGLYDEDALSAGSVVISEIMQNPEAVPDDKGEYFELHNPGGEDLVISGWEISDGAFDRYVVPAAPRLVLEAGGYLVFGLVEDSRANGGVEVDVVVSTFRLANTTDSVIVKAGSVELDRVTYDETTWPDPSGASLTLDTLRLSATANNDATSWCISSSAITPSGDNGTPGRAGDLCPQFDHDDDGLAGDQGDCDDTDAAIFAGAWEDPRNTLDDNCDGEIDEPFDVVSILDLWEIVDSEGQAGLGYDPGADMLLLTDRLTDRIYRVDPRGGLDASFVAGFNLGIGGITFDDGNNNFWLALGDDTSGLNEDTIVPYSASLQSHNSPVKLAFTATNANDTEDPTGIAWDARRGALYLLVCYGVGVVDDAQCTDGPSLVEVTRTGDLAATLLRPDDFFDSTARKMDAQDLAVVPTTGEILFPNVSGTAIYALDPVSGGLSSLYDLTDLGSPTLIEMNPFGDLAVATDDGFLFLIDTTGDGAWTRTSP